MQIPGSSYKCVAMYPTNDPNSIEGSNARPQAKSTTRLQNLSIAVAGQQLQQPQYQGLDAVKLPLRPYADYLACQGSITSTSETVPTTLEDYSSAPHYVSRIVQPVTSGPKEAVIRSQHATADLVERCKAELRKTPQARARALGGALGGVV